MLPSIYFSRADACQLKKEIMKRRLIRDRVEWLGVIDWNRRLFDSLIPLPDGTSYNAYLIQGSEKTAILDSVDPAMELLLMDQLADVPKIDYVVSHHTEQDHSGVIPVILRKYPCAQVLCTPKAKELLIDHLHIAADRIRTVDDGESISLGDKTLKFVHTPWVHWPETMMTYLPEDKILFSCDLFGSHVATTNLYAGDSPAICEASKRYYAEVMMPFRKIIQNHLKKIQALEFDLIAPSHGPIYDKPNCILDAHKDWVSEKVSNLVVLPYISMHGSTEIMVNHLVGSLTERGVNVQKFELTVTDLGKLAIALVDAATIVIGTPTVHLGPHPLVFSATHLANALRPKLRHAAIIGSYGWGTKAVEQISTLIPNLKVEVLGTVMCKGLPRGEDFAALDILADKIKEKHAGL
jgi:flavorubredoxin